MDTNEKLPEQHERAIYMTMINPASTVFVKELEFFREQGGFVEEWGRDWVPVVARNIDEARELRKEMCATEGERKMALRACKEAREARSAMKTECDRLRAKLRAFEEAIEVEEGRVVATDWSKLQAIFDAAQASPAAKT